MRKKELLKHINLSILIWLSIEKEGNKLVKEIKLYIRSIKNYKTITFLEKARKTKTRKNTTKINIYSRGC